MTKKSILRAIIIVLCVAIVALVMPRNDRSTFTYEEGQPWRYSLLTAPFDIPVYLDSTTYRHMSDSITTNFSPYVHRSQVKEAQVQDLLTRNNVSALKIPALSRLMTTCYARGVMSDELKKHVQGTSTRTVRTVSAQDDNMANSVDASDMYSASEAARWVVDNYDPNGYSLYPLTPGDIEAITRLIVPNIVNDTVNSEKFLDMELAAVNAGQGKIRQGQRIVDRGEIITPQIYRNLQTYEEMQAKSDVEDNSHQLIMFLAQLLYIIIVFAIIYLYLYVYRPKVFAHIPSLTFIMTLITLFAVLASVMIQSFTLGMYLTPFATVPVMILIFIDSRTAFMALLATVLLCVQMATYQYQFMVMEIITGFMAVISLNQLSRRSQLLRSSLVVFVSYAVTWLTLYVIGGGDFSDLDWHQLMAYAINAVLFSLTYVLIVLVEKVFGFTSAVTLVELSDINNPLLRRLAEEAPGTFQHSMQVSTLAADAAHAIGANTQLVRTGALYHDIGKMVSPVFFTENQHGVNPHNGLDPETSARKIISHVTEGVAMAEKAKLPRIITDFIREHHGRGLTRYFYTTACNNSPDGEVNPTSFTYPGPDPQSKETAILMMADAVEAASRSLREYTPQTISDLVDKIVDNQVKEGRFKESPISFADVERIKDTFKRRLSTIYHTRVAYPDRKKP